MSVEPRLADEDYCYITTTGRVTGRPHTVEIWFAIAGDVLYVLAGSGTKADFVRNAMRFHEVTVRIDEHTFLTRARVVEDPDEDGLARRLLLDKYRPRYSGSLGRWGRTALPVAFELGPEQAAS